MRGLPPRVSPPNARSVGDGGTQSSGPSQADGSTDSTIVLLVLNVGQLWVSLSLRGKKSARGKKRTQQSMHCSKKRTTL